MNFRPALALRNQACLNLQALLDGSGIGAKITIYGGPQPTASDSPLGPQNQLLVAFPLLLPSFLPPINGTMALNVPPSAYPITAGSASFARWTAANGAVAFDCDAGAAGTTLLLSSQQISPNIPISIVSFAVVVPAS